MKYTEKAPYQAPGMGDLDLLLERAILTVSVYTPVTEEANEGFEMTGSYSILE